MKRQKWDEREEAVRNRAWRRTCFAVLAAVVVNGIMQEAIGYSVTSEAMPLVLLWFAIGVHSIQAIWGRAYVRPGEDSPVVFFLVVGMFVVGIIAFVRHVRFTGKWFNASGVMVVAPTMTLGLVLVTAASRWWVDRRATFE